MKYVLDIETTIDKDIIRLAVLYCIDTDEYDLCFDESTMGHRLLQLTEKDYLITYNGSGFDMPKVEELWDIDILALEKSVGFTHVDAYKLSKMLFPDRPQGHSLRSWGEELYPHDESKWKGVVDYDKSGLTELGTYCVQDCMLTGDVCNYLTNISKESKGKYSHALKVEQKVQEIVNRQVDKKVHFDKYKAGEVLGELNRELNLLEVIINKEMPILPLPLTKLHYPPKIQFKKNGDLSVALKNYCRKYDALIQPLTKTVIHKGSTYSLPLKAPLVTKFKLQVTQSAELKKYLLDRGWKPTMWNRKKFKGRSITTSPKLTDPVTKEPCPNLEKLGFTVAREIAKWLMLRSRRNCIRSDKGTGWLSQLDKHGDLPSDCDPLGTPTARFRHKGIVNIPRVTTPYGKELRSLFCARDKKLWVGWDASQLEARMEAHYTYPIDSGKYATELLGGDIHEENRKELGLGSRDRAKEYKYMVTYGAQPPKIAQQMGWTIHESERIFKRFWDVNDTLKKLKGELLREWEMLDSEHLIGLDGRLITTRYKHALLNTKFQSAGAIVMKHAMLIADRTINNKFKEEQAYGLIRYHDEEVWECDPTQAGEVGRMGVQSIVKAGEYLKLNVPLDGDYHIGFNWSEVH